MTRVLRAGLSRRGASSGDALLALGWFRPHPKELGDISQKPDESDRRGSKTAARIDDNLGSREFEVTAPRQNPAPACRKDILDPPGIRSIGEEKDVVIAAAEHVNRRVVHFSRGSPPISQDAESGCAAGEHTSDWVDEARDEMTKMPQPRSVRHALPSLAPYFTSCNCEACKENASSPRPKFHCNFGLGDQPSWLLRRESAAKHLFKKFEATVAPAKSVSVT